MALNSWDWFCGVNNSEPLPDTKAVLTNACTINGTLIVPHAIFVVLAPLQLTFLACWRAHRKIQTSMYHIRFPGHSIRWIVALFIAVVGLACVAEGILTDNTFKEHDQPSQPHLFMPGIFITVGTMVSILYYNCAESWKLKHMLWLLLCYWIISLATVCLRLQHILLVEVGGIKLMRYELVILLTTSYSLLLVIEVTVMLKLMSGRRSKYVSESVPVDHDKGCMFFRDTYSNLLSQLSFWWLNFIFIHGFKRPVNHSKLGSIPEIHTADYNYSRFRKNYNIEMKRAREVDKPLNLLRVLAATYWPKIVAGGGLKLISDMLSYVGPIAIGGITLFVTRTLYQDKTEEKPPPHAVTVREFFTNGYVLIGCVFITSLIQHTCNQTHQYWVSMEGLHAKSALQSMIYEKSLRLSTYAISGGTMTMGQVTNHMSVDVNNIMTFFQNVNDIWSIPVKITVALVLLYFELGFAALIAAALFAIVIPLQMIIATTMAGYTKAVLTSSDYRLRISNEMLQGMKLLKLYGWEYIYYETVKAARNREIRHLIKVYVFFAITFSINTGTPIIVTLVAFGLYTPLNSNPLTPDKAFSSLALFNQITAPFFAFPYIISLSVNLLVSTKRLVVFLTGQEVKCLHDDKGKIADMLFKDGPEDGEAFADKKNTIPMVNVKRTVLPVVLESDGDETGDDEVFQGTMEDIQAEQKVHGDQINEKHIKSGVSNGWSNAGKDTTFAVSSVSEAEWLPDDVAIRIRNGNFAWDPKSDDPDVHDVNVDIPAGKLTVIAGSVGSGKSSMLEAIIGEMTTLSGTVQIHKDKRKFAYAPQKAWLVNATLRNNILFGKQMDSKRYTKVISACALKADIDMLPGKDRTEIGEKGINLSGGQKQRVSVARAIYSSRDIVILDDPLSALDMHVGAELFHKGIMGILRQYDQTVILVTHQLQYLPEADMIVYMEDGRIKYQGSPERITQAYPDIAAECQQAIRRVSESDTNPRTESTTEIERKTLRRQLTRQISILNRVDSVIEDERGRLIVEEERETGAVSYHMYRYYLSAVGYILAILIFCSIAVRAALQIVTNFWLSNWSEAGLNMTGDTQPTSYYITGYAGYSIGTVVSQIIFNIVANAGALIAARSIHFLLLENLIRIPMRFFDVTPVGRILSRLASDTYLIDQRLIVTINMLLNSFVNVIASIVVNSVVNPYFLLLFAPFLVLFFALLVYYIRTSRELQRIESISRSPIFAHFSETLGGLPSIRAYNAETRFFRVISDRIDVNNTAHLYLLTAQRWLGIRLDCLGSIVVLVAGLCSVLGAFYLGIEASLVGLAISYSLTMSDFLNLLVKSCSYIELQMNAVERVRFYAEVENEQYQGKEPPSDWPSKGEIVMDNISVRYAPELDPVLHGINIKIKPASKIGICGRTGSGKSSLTLALFRIIDTFQGRILIDGIDIASVPLRSLRQRLSIIPQDAFLFTGTIRSNLDPTNSQDDKDLWNALEISQLKETVMQLDGGLDSEVIEGGENFSVGQRQLFCLARAFLRDACIIVMDEATASIDQETDQILQKVLSRVFKGRTIITIAHRVDTILNANFILTLADGKVAEFDTPKNLLRQHNSIFASLVRAWK